MADFNEIKDISNDLKHFSETTNKVMKDTLSELKGLINLYNSSFKESKDDVENLLSYSKEFRLAHDELVEKIKIYHRAIKEVNDELEEQKEYYSLNDDEQNKIVESVIKFKERLKEVNDLRKKSLDTSLSREERRYAKEKHDLLIKQNKQLVQSIINSSSLSNASKKYFKELISTNKLTMDSLLNIKRQKEEIVDLEEKNNVLANNTFLAYSKSSNILDAIVTSLKSAFGVIKSGANYWIEYNDMAVKSGRAIGMNSKQLRAHNLSLLSETKRIAAAYGISGEQMIKLQNSYAESTNRAIILTRDETENLAAMTRLAGDGVVNEMVGTMDKFGASTDVAMYHLEKSMKTAMRFGLTASKMSEALVKNIGLAQRYTFKNGIDGVTKMTALSQTLRFNMESIASAADKFSTIEGAISTSANLQVLGGSYAANFSNPMAMMYKALNDFEGFTETIVDTWGSKGVFNRETGVVEIGSFDKRLIQESAKQLGISYEESMTIAQRNVINKEIGSQINKMENFSDNDKAAISNLARYDASDGQFKVNYYVAGQGKVEKNVSDITQNDMQDILADTSIEEAIQDDTSDIRKNIDSFLNGTKDRAVESTSYKERRDGFKEAGRAIFAEGADKFMTVLNNFTLNFAKSIKDMQGWQNSIFDFISNHSTTALFVSAIVGGLSAGITSYFAGKLLPMINGALKLGGKFLGGIGRAVGRGRRGTNNISNLSLSSAMDTLDDFDDVGEVIPRRQNNRRRNNKRRNNRRRGNNSARTSNIEVNPFNRNNGGNAFSKITKAKPFKWLKKIIPSKLKLALNAVDMLPIAASLFGDSSSSAESELTTNNGIIDEVLNDDSLSELEKQTKLLEVIANGGSDNVKASSLMNTNSVNNELVSNSNTNSVKTNNLIDDGSITNKVTSNTNNSIAVSKIKHENRLNKYEERGELIGGTIGGMVGAMIPVPVVGQIVGGLVGDMLGGFVGGKIGRFVGEMTANDEENINSTKVTNNKVVNDNSVRYNNSKNGINNISPSEMYHMSNYDSLSYDEKVRFSETYNNVMPRPIVNNNDSIRALPISKNMTYVSPNSMIDSNVNSTLKIPDIKININGNIKLTSDNKSVDIDINKLLDNQQFKETLVKMVKDGLDRNQGVGKINRNNVTNMRTSSGH